MTVDNSLGAFHARCVAKRRRALMAGARPSFQVMSETKIKDHDFEKELGFKDHHEDKLERLSFAEEFERSWNDGYKEPRGFEDERNI